MSILESYRGIAPDPRLNGARYAPFASGVFRMEAGMRPLGTDCGFRDVDSLVFQIDRNFSVYRKAKLLARRESLPRYFQTHDLDTDTENGVARFMAQQAAVEHPEHFTLKEEAGGWNLECRLTGDTLCFGSSWVFLPERSVFPADCPQYVSGLDALACQFQEDFAVMRRSPDGNNWAAAIHLCFPNHWAPEDKIGRSFGSIHRNIPGIERVTDAEEGIVRSIVAKKSFVRFAWGLSTDTRLNHHPRPPEGVEEQAWCGRNFVPAEPRLFVRVERQVTCPFMELGASLFLIRTYFLDCAELRQDPVLCSPLISAIESMSPSHLNYKGLTRDKEAIVAWLRQES